MTSRIARGRAVGLAALGLLATSTINNLGTVNDTSVECHRSENEIEDVHCADIAYTYIGDPYGTPRIAEGNSNPLHPKVRVCYESAKNPNGTWAAHTAIHCTITGTTEES